MEFNSGFKGLNFNQNSKLKSFVNEIAGDNRTSVLSGQPAIAQI